jgi:UDP-glucose 4-epimerase
MTDFKGNEVLITGGLGFIGSNLAHMLFQKGAKVTILDAKIEGLGWNIQNISEIKDKIKVVIADVRDEKIIAEAVKGKDLIFHLAGQVDHQRSVDLPFEDLDIKCKGTLTLLEACRKNNRTVKIVYSGTRAEYGSVQKLPAKENSTPTNPIGMYAITSLAAENMMLMYHRIHGIKTCCARITNTFGPRHQMKKPNGVVNWFIRQIIDNRPIELMGNGRYLRDLLYVDDCCEALLTLATSEESTGHVYNVASGKGISFLNLAKEIIKSNGSGTYKLIPYKEEIKQLEPGNFFADNSKLKKLGWSPGKKLDEGIRQTIRFYRAEKKHYW